MGLRLNRGRNGSSEAPKVPGWATWVMERVRGGRSQEFPPALTWQEGQVSPEAPVVTPVCLGVGKGDGLLATPTWYLHP